MASKGFAICEFSGQVKDQKQYFPAVCFRKIKICDCVLALCGITAIITGLSQFSCFGFFFFSFYFLTALNTKDVYVQGKRLCRWCDRFPGSQPVW